MSIIPYLPLLGFVDSHGHYILVTPTAERTYPRFDRQASVGVARGPANLDHVPNPRRRLLINMAQLHRGFPGCFVKVDAGSMFPLFASQLHIFSLLWRIICRTGHKFLPAARDADRKPKLRETFANGIIVGTRRFGCEEATCRHDLFPFTE